MPLAAISVLNLNEPLEPRLNKLAPLLLSPTVRPAFKPLSVPPTLYGPPTTGVLATVKRAASFTVLLSVTLIAGALKLTLAGKALLATVKVYAPVASRVKLLFVMTVPALLLSMVATVDV